LDIPTQLGYDSDHPLACGEVGKVGVAIDSLRDFEILFDGIPLDRVRYIRINFNALGPIGAALAIAVGEKQGLSPDQFNFVLQNDPFREFIARKLYIFPPKPSLRMAVDVIEYCSKNCPTWQPIHVSGYQTREAGSTAIQEVAFTLASVIAYVESAVQRGILVDAFARNICVLLNLHMDLIEEVAKIRAFRKLWSRIMQDRFNALDAASLRPRLLNATAGSACLAQQPLNNIIRITLGGSYHINAHCFDEGLAIPTEEAAEIAARTQQIIAEESGVTNTIDPMGGSYFLESLTLSIEAEVWRYLEKIENKGGALACIESGYFQNEISKAAWEYQQQIENGQKVKVGLNKYKKEEDISIKTLKVSPTIEAEMIKRVKQLRQERDNQAVKKRLAEIREVAQGTDNMVPVILEAIKTYATVGEISDVLRDVFGAFNEQNAT
jgi:methylmalonyl-CoA mutase N-terminal domain/subunit